MPLSAEEQLFFTKLLDSVTLTSADKGRLQQLAVAAFDAGGGGGGGLSQIWQPGTTFVGTGNGVVNAPGGGGLWSGYEFTNGQDRFAHTNINIPATWTEFTYTLYVASNNDNDFTFEVAYQLSTDGDVLNPNQNAAAHVIPAAGAVNGLAIGSPVTILNPDGDTMLGFRVRSNNATQTNFGPPVIVGVLLQQTES